MNEFARHPNRRRNCFPHHEGSRTAKVRIPTGRTKTVKSALGNPMLVLETILVSPEKLAEKTIAEIVEEHFAEHARRDALDDGEHWNI